MTGKKIKVKISFILLIITTVIFLTEGIAFAKEPEFRLNIDSLNLEKGVSADLVFSISNAKSSKKIAIKGLENFDILSTRQSSAISIVNGSSTNQKEVTYSIMPKKTGQFTLQGSVEYKGTTYETNKLEINISEGSNTTTNGEAENLFIKTLISDDEIYFGQKVILGYELYSRYNIENFGFLDAVNIDQFITEDISQEKLNSNYTTINGDKYVKYRVKQMYLSPMKTGTTIIPSYNFQVNVSTGDFFSSSKPVYLQTKAKKLTVKSLPLENKPTDFSGIVGNLSLESKYSKNEIEYGDSVTLKVTATSTGNLENLKKIIKDELPGFSVYETEKDLVENVENNQYKAQKKFEIILVPEKNGHITIDPIYISYFDTKLSSYKKVEIPGTTITVKGDMPQVQNEVQNQSEPTSFETVKIDQVNYGVKDNEYVTIKFKKTNLLIGLIVFVMVLVLGIAAFFIFVYYKKKNKKLQYIYKQLKNSDDQNEIYNLFNSMIKYRFNVSLKASSRNTIITQLSEYEIRESALEIMNYMENEKDNTNRSSKYLKDKIKKIYNKHLFS